MFEGNNRMNCINGVLPVPSITVNVYMGERQPIRRRRRTISIDGIPFNSFDDAVSYLMADGMTSKEALSYLSRREAF